MSNQNKGLLLANLGSPNSTSVEDVQRYLDEFLMDKWVIDYPYFFRYFLMHRYVIPKRAPKSAESYKKVWTKEGSPLIIEAERLTQKVRQKANFPVSLCMRYGTPTATAAFKELLEQDKNLSEVVVLPLYPHYTMSSFKTAVEAIKRIHKKHNYPFKLTFLNPFYNHPAYISALSARIKPYLKQDYDKILFSYHGLPERHMKKDDKEIEKGGHPDYKLPKVNYQQQAHETTRLVVEQLNIPEGKWETSFQSRLAAAGKEWLKPYTAVRLEELPQEGIKNLLVVCPAFINDCLETLEEIGIEGKESFEEAGGNNLTLIPCINNQEEFADTLIEWAKNGQ